MKNFSDEILAVFKEFSGEDVIKTEDLKGGVSDKLILRITTKNGSIVGVYNSNIKENIAFIGFTSTFRNLKLNVPEVIHVNNQKTIYFISDLGKQTLFEFSKNIIQSISLMDVHKMILKHLIKFQILGAKHIDFGLCCETKVFDEYQIEIDVAKFKKYFLKKHMNNTSALPDTETMNRLLDLTIRSAKNYFMYRDFQPRNIIMNNGIPYFVDYQSGRFGPNQYDLISFLYSGSINISNDERSELKEYYIKEFSQLEVIKCDEFLSSLDYFALLRIIQVLGSYCWTAYENYNVSVLNKIPTAIRNLKSISLSDPLIESFRIRLIELCPLL